MQPKLSGDTFYLPTADGIYLRNNRHTLTLEGQDIYQWIEALEPFLNGQYTLEAIVDDLEAEQKMMVRNIVETLSTQGFLKDLSSDLPHTLDEDELATYASEIAFIDSFRDSAAATFEHFRTQRVLVIGSGLSVLALIHAILQSGTRETTLWITNECETSTQRLRAYRQQVLTHDPHQILLAQQVPNWQDEDNLREALQAFDVIFHLSDRPMLKRSLELNRLCFALHKPLFQAIILDHQALIGPLVYPDKTGCWECAWRRWLSNLDTPEQSMSHDPWQDELTAPVSLFLGLPTAATIANMLSFEYFKYFTKAGSCEIESTVLHLNLETLQCQNLTFLPHPICQTCQHPAPLNETTFLQRIRSLEEREPLEEEAFDQRVIACFDPLLGIFPYLGEDNFVQVPLNVSSLTISAPLFPQRQQEPLTFIRAHLGLGTLRRKLTLQGCAFYAARLTDQRQLISDAHGTWVWAYNLSSRQARLVPARQAHPPVDNQQSVPSFPGISAGLSWAEACVHALLDHCLNLTLQELSLKMMSYAEVPLEALAVNKQESYLRSLIEMTGQSLHVYNVTGWLQVPTLAFCVGDKTLLYTTHLDIVQALDEGMQSVVQHFQAIQEEQMAYALPAVPQLPPAARGNFDLLPTDAMPVGWQARLDWLINTLALHRWHALALPLDHDPALHAILPFLVRVMLVQEEA